MARPRLVLLRWATKFRSWWKADYFLWIAVALVPVAIVVPHYLIKAGHHPPVGTYIAILGVLATAVTLRKDPPLPEKAAWVFLFALLAVAEIRNLYVEDNEETVKFGLIQSGLEATNQGLQNTVTALGTTATSLQGISGEITTTNNNSHKQFEKTMNRFGEAQIAENKNFAGVLNRQESAFEQQHELSEELFGRLVPGNAPTPENGCSTLLSGRSRLPILSDEQKELSEGKGVLVITGDNADVATRFPHTILMVDKFPILSVDRIENSDDLALSVDIRYEANRIAFRMDKNGVENRTASFIFLHPDKSTFLLQDQFGKEIFRARFLNRTTFEVTGILAYCGRAVSVQSSLFHKSCSMGNVGVSYDGAPACPTPQ
jgi:hypothetical protein